MDSSQINTLDATPSTNSDFMFVIVIVVTLIVVLGGGYWYYTKYINPKVNGVAVPSNKAYVAYVNPDTPNQTTVVTDFPATLANVGIISANTEGHGTFVVTGSSNGSPVNTTGTNFNSIPNFSGLIALE